MSLRQRFSANEAVRDLQAPGAVGYSIGIARSDCLIRAAIERPQGVEPPRSRAIARRGLAQRGARCPVKTTVVQELLHHDVAAAAVAAILVAECPVEPHEHLDRQLCTQCVPARSLLQPAGALLRALTLELIGHCGVNTFRQVLEMQTVEDRSVRKNDHLTPRHRPRVCDFTAEDSADPRVWELRDDRLNWTDPSRIHEPVPVRRCVFAQSDESLVVERRPVRRRIRERAGHTHDFPPGRGESTLDGVAVSIER